MIWYLIWNIKMANFNFLLYPRYRDTIGMDCDGNWYIPELEIVSLNWGYIPNFGDRPPKESNAQNPPQIVSTLSECLLLIGSNNLGKSFPRWKQLVLVLMYDGLWISELWC